MKPVGESLPAVFLIGALSMKIQILILITMQETIMTEFGIQCQSVDIQVLFILLWPRDAKWLKMVKSSWGLTRGMLGVSVSHSHHLLLGFTVTYWNSKWDKNQAEVSAQCNKHLSATVISNSDAKSVVVEVAPLTGGNRRQCELNTRCLHTVH